MGPVLLRLQYTRNYDLLYLFYSFVLIDLTCSGLSVDSALASKRLGQVNSFDIVHEPTSRLPRQALHACILLSTFFEGSAVRIEVA